MANICRTIKIAMLIDIKLEEMSETGELWAEKGGIYSSQENDRRKGFGSMFENSEEIN